jgi:SAM-dependent methyltransferase
MDNEDYAMRLQLISKKWWKKLLGPINPYRRNLRNLVRGNCLEVGCGIGRNLSYLDNSDNVGIDLNLYALDVARSLGHTVMMNSEFKSHDQYLAGFDNLLFSHVLEHMDQGAAIQLVNDYLPYLNKDGKLVIICPQKRGFDSDESHV